MGRGLLLLVVCALVAAPAEAKKRTQKADETAPRIEHTPPASHDGKALRVDAKITDPSGVFEPTLLVRKAGSKSVFLRIALDPVPGKKALYRGEVPSELLDSDIEYLLEAFDTEGNGPARVGEEASPIRVKMQAETKHREPLIREGTGDDGANTAEDSDSDAGAKQESNGSASAGEPATQKVSPLDEPAPTDEGDGSGLWLGLGVGAGVLVVLAAAGAGAWVLLHPPEVVRVHISGPAPVGAAQ